MAETTLKPCPFCGGEAEIIEGEEMAYVQCQSMKMHRSMFFDGDNNAAQEVAEQWNRRALSASPPPPSVPVGVMVKPLEWEGAPAGEERYGIQEFGYYIVTWIDPCHVVSTFTNKGAMRNVGQFKELENAYSAAQTDYETRILSALSAAVPQTEAVEPFGTYQERDNGVGEFRRVGDPHTPTASGYKCWTLYATPPTEPALIAERTWQPMDTAPKDGKHCILAVQEGAFIWSVQGVFRNGQWDAVHRENVDPLYWMPNVRLPVSAALSDGRQR